MSSRKPPKRVITIMDWFGLVKLINSPNHLTFEPSGNLNNIRLPIDTVWFFFGGFEFFGFSGKRFDKSIPLRSFLIIHYEMILLAELKSWNDRPSSTFCQIRFSWLLFLSCLPSFISNFPFRFTNPVLYREMLPEGIIIRYDDLNGDGKANAIRARHNNIGRDASVIENADEISWPV